MAQDFRNVVPLKRTALVPVLAFALVALVTVLAMEAMATLYCYGYKGNGPGARVRAIAEREHTLSMQRNRGGLQEDPERRWENSLVVHPFFGYVHNPRLPGVNNFGFETPYNIALCGTQYCLDPPVQNPLVVGIFGGSFAELTGRHSAYLEQQLKGLFPDRTPVVINFAVGGHALPQSAFIFIYFRQLLDVAIFLDGLNEVWNPIENNHTGVPPEFAKAAHFLYKLSLAELSPRNFEITHEIMRWRGVLLWLTRWSLLPSLRHSLAVHYLWRALDKYLNTVIQLRMVQIKESYSDRGDFFPVSDEAILEFAVAQWESYHRLIHSVALDSGILDLHLLQPNPHVPNSKTLTDEERRVIQRPFPKKEYVLNGYPKLRPHVFTLRAEGCVAEDLSLIFSKEHRSIWTDAAHANTQGSHIVLDRVVELIHASQQSAPR